MSLLLKKTDYCPICKQANLKDALQIHYWREFLLDFSECQNCGAVFSNPMPSDELISQGNSALVRLYQQGRTEEQEFRDARQAYLRGKMLAQKLTRWKKNGRMLELGCYQGFFSLGVKENSNWQVEGLEISTELSHFVRGKIGIECIVGTLEEATLPEERYDFVVCHDLIEHINRPEIFLRKLSSILSPGGRVQIITPNAIQDLGFTKRAFAAGTPTTMILNHILNFSPKALKLALTQVGLNPIRTYCYDVRHAAKDFGWLGAGKPKNILPGPSMVEALALPTQNTLRFWTPEKLAQLKGHPKVSATYGFLKETLPQAFTIRMPARFGIGHEIYSLAEKRLASSDQRI